MVPGSDPAAAAALGADTDAAVAVSVAMRSDVWRRFKKNRLAVAGLTFLGLLVLAAIFAPLITKYDPERIVAIGREREGPTTDHWFGTTEIGRDMFSRIIYGARVSLKVGISATLIAITIGVILGATAGFFGGWLEALIMRITDVFLSMPYIILAIAIATVFGRSENSVIVVLGMTGWLAICRIVRATFLQLKQLEYVEAARALGFGNARIMFRHLLPNALQPIIVYGTISVGTVILAETALSFLGVGVQDPTPSWGLMISTAQGQFAAAPHLLFFPGAAIVMTVLALVFVGDGLRDALDPRLK
jgi:ABC-type dipeptide/oligopeptide/nickel transport system permease subunit